MLNGAEILKVDRPEKLFKGSEDEIKKQFHELARQFHPDTNPGNEDAFKRINDLYHEVLERIKNGTWGLEGAYRVELRDGGHHDIHNISNRPFELGHMYIGNDHVTYLVDDIYKELFYNATKTKSFRFGNRAMRDEIEKCLPRNLQVLKLKDGRRGLWIDKDPELLNLRDVLIYFKGRVPGRHMAWIIGTLNNLACYLNYTRISHQDISPDTYFIHPRMHSGALLGGWWYAKRFRESIKYVPVRTLDLMPFRPKVTKKASHLTDLELIRGLGREILGDELKVPEPMVNWLTSVATKDAIGNYEEWIKARDESGPRKFIPLNLDAEKLYETS
jgi:hypothetical protein